MNFGGEIKTLLAKLVLVEQNMNQGNLFHRDLFVKNRMGVFAVFRI